MCELFGASLNRSMDLREYLKIFYSHSVRHPHGWGLMREEQGHYHVIKEPVCATGSRMLHRVVEQTTPQKALLAHIRLATIGSRKQENSHPFTAQDSSGRQWTLIHNGTIYSSGTLSRYLECQQGETDSERVFLYFMDLLKEEIERNGVLDAKQRFAVFERLVAELSARNKLNLLIFDGEYLYAHTNMKDTLHYKEMEQGILISTEPLNEEKWEKMPMCRAFAYRDGVRVFEGEEATEEFVPTLDYINAYYAAMNI